MLDEKNYRFIWNNKIIDLTKIETKLLAFFIENKGKINNLDEISDSVYGAWRCN